MSVFQVVRFPNAVCAGTTSYNGTCYTSSECSNKGGTSSGSCANGFGVCCVFTLGCGGVTSQNCSYFLSSTTVAAGQCGIKVCKCSSDICQLRMDFSTFVIAGPATTVTAATSTYTANGAPIGTGGKGSSFATQCLTDKFTVTGTGSSPPVICGTNTGYHMYADASDSCNFINFELGQTGVYTTIPTRQWNIKITQISCYDVTLAPTGCTQYYYGSTTGMVNTYNYAGSFHLANQRQQICFRRERNYCRICYYATATDFSLSGIAAAGKVAAGACCGYGAAGLNTATAYDCLLIPGASSTGKVMKPNSICGNGVGLVTAASGAIKTICSYQNPFMLSFISDSFEQVVPEIGTKGFKITWWQTTC